MWLRKNSVWIWARIKQPLNTVRFIATQHYTMMRISMINVCTYWCLIIFNKYTPVCQRDVPKSVVVNLVEKNVYTCLKNRTQQKKYILTHSENSLEYRGIFWIYPVTPETIQTEFKISRKHGLKILRSVTDLLFDPLHTSTP